MSDCINIGIDLIKNVYVSKIQKLENEIISLKQTMTQVDSHSNKYKEILQTLEEQNNSLTIENIKLKQKNKSLFEENEDLKNFKQNILKALSFKTSFYGFESFNNNNRELNKTHSFVEINSLSNDLNEEKENESFTVKSTKENKKEQKIEKILENLKQKFKKTENLNKNIYINSNFNTLTSSTEEGRVNNSERNYSNFKTKLENLKNKLMIEKNMKRDQQQLEDENNYKHENNEEQILDISEESFIETRNKSENFVLTSDFFKLCKKILSNDDFNKMLENFNLFNKNLISSEDFYEKAKKILQNNEKLFQKFKNIYQITTSSTSL